MTAYFETREQAEQFARQRPGAYIAQDTFGAWMVVWP